MAFSSTSYPPAAVTRNWLDLPRDVTAMILHKLGAIEILESAQKVCVAWHEICKDPAMWRIIDMRISDHLFKMNTDFDKMGMDIIDRTCGQLVDITIEDFGVEIFLEYIVERTSKLRRLELIACYDLSDEGLSEVAKGLPLLEELHISYTPLSEEAIAAVGRCCPLLKSFSFNICGEYDGEPLVIAGNMPELRHLQLRGHGMTNVGLQAILDGCPHLESLDLRQCCNVNLDGDLGKGLDMRIKDLRLLHDSTEGDGFNTDIDFLHAYDISLFD